MRLLFRNLKKVTPPSPTLSPAYLAVPLSLRPRTIFLISRQLSAMSTQPTADFFKETRLDLVPDNADELNAQRLHGIGRNFMSDTLTAPDPAMFAYAIRGTLGDAVFEEPNTTQFEEHVAKIAGKEAGLFVPSGTFSNQLGMRSHLTQPPHSVLLDYRAHIYCHEAGGLAYHSQALPIPVKPTDGKFMTLADVKENGVWDEEIHGATTRVIALENTLNGMIYPQDEIIKISDFAREQGVIMHLDGARIWHVAAKTGTSLKELCAPFDSVSMCFSKGLGAPIGSVLVGSKKFITRARWLRKCMGGGMRQTGFMAAAATYALNNNFPKLTTVHALATKLEKGLTDLGVRITVPVDTCMVWFDAAHLGVSVKEVVQTCRDHPDPIYLYGERLVVHVQTTPEAIQDIIDIFNRLIEEKKAAGFVPDSATLNGNASQPRTRPYEDASRK